MSNNLQLFYVATPTIIHPIHEQMANRMDDQACRTHLGSMMGRGTLSIHVGKKN